MAHFKIVKLLKGEKIPADRGWQNNPIDQSSDEGKLLLERVGKGYVNYGVHAGASGLLIVDVDPKNGGNPKKFFDTWPATRTVRTPSGGYHFYYEWDGSAAMSGRRTPEPGVDFIVGQAQAVGAGSSVKKMMYAVERDLPIAKAPQFGIDLCLSVDESKSQGANVLAGEDASAEGRNNSLAKTMGIARRAGLVDANVEAFALAMNALLPDPLPEDEVRNTIVVSALRWPVGEDESDEINFTIIGTEATSLIGNSDDLPEVGEFPIRWIVDDFVPEAELTIIWGGPKVGKSTWCAWVAARASRQQKRVLFVGAGEERAEVFAAKFRESGGDMAYFDFWRGPQLKFPKHAKFFTEAIKDKGYGLVYFDSLRAVMDADAKKNEADRSRDALQPIALIAQEVGVSVLLTTHPMKAKPTDPVEVMLGSTELKAVARCVLHAKKGNTDNTFFVTVDSTNTRKPDEDLLVIRAERPFCDHRTGAVQTEIREDGTEREMKIPYIAQVERVSKGASDAMPSQKDDGFEEQFEAFSKAYSDGVVRTPEEAFDLFQMPKAVFYRYRNKLQASEMADIRTELAV